MRPLRTPLLHASERPRPRAFDGWALEAAAQIDCTTPSFLAHTLYASGLKRQAIFCALSEFGSAGAKDLAARLRAVAPADCDRGVDPLAQIGRALVVGKARDLVGAVYGQVPDGHLGALARLGADPMPNPSDYRDLFSLLVEPGHRWRAKVLLQNQGAISATKIAILSRLEQLLVHPNILTRLHSLDQVEGLHASLGLVRATCSTATDDALRQSISQLSPKCSLRDWVARWLAKADIPLVHPPIPANDPDLTVLSPQELRAAGIAWSNCLGLKHVQTVVGESAFVLWEHPPGAVIELRRLSNGLWVQSGIYGRGNSLLDPSVARKVRRKLKDIGVVSFAPAALAGALPAFKSLMGHWTADDDALAGLDIADEDLSAATAQEG